MTDRETLIEFTKEQYSTVPNGTERYSTVRYKILKKSKVQSIQEHLAHAVQASDWQSKA